MLEQGDTTNLKSEIRNPKFKMLRKADLAE